MRRVDLEKASMADLIKAAESLVVISVIDGSVFVSYSDDMDEMKTLDLLAFTTAEFYNGADEGTTNLH